MGVEDYRGLVFVFEALHEQLLCKNEVPQFEIGLGTHNIELAVDWLLVAIVIAQGYFCLLFDFVELAFLIQNVTGLQKCADCLIVYRLMYLHRACKPVIGGSVGLKGFRGLLFYREVGLPYGRGSECESVLLSLF